MRLVRADFLARAAGQHLARAISESIETTGRCRLALSGGSTPRGTFEWLRESLDPGLYPRIWVTWADERQLPVGRTDPWWAGYAADSNLRMAYDHWLGHVPPVGRVLPLCDGTPLDERQRAVGAAFDSEWGGLDVVHLGVGPDGHIASLFPDHPALDAPGPVVAVRGSPKPPPERLSLSLDTLAATPRIAVIVRGEDKADVLLRAWMGDPSLPLTRLAQRAPLTLICDRAAARKLPESP